MPFTIPLDLLSTKKVLGNTALFLECYCVLVAVRAVPDPPESNEMLKVQYVCSLQKKHICHCSAKSIERLK